MSVVNPSQLLRNWSSPYYWSLRFGLPRYLTQNISFLPFYIFKLVAEHLTILRHTWDTGWILAEALKSSWNQDGRSLIRMLTNRPFIQSPCRKPLTLVWQSSVCLTNFEGLEWHFRTNWFCLTQWEQVFPLAGQSPLRFSCCKPHKLHVTRLGCVNAFSSFVVLCSIRCSN